MLRREFCAAAAAALAGSATASPANGLKVATFKYDVTPPLGHPLCGGWIKPAGAVDLPLEARGIVILGADKPIVLCAVDWTGLLNDAHAAWTEALAKGAGTTPDRVAVQCVHQHNAPFVCPEMSRLLVAAGGDACVVPEFFRECLERGRRAAAKSLAGAAPWTHAAFATGKIEQVASNRRHLGSDGKIAHWRASSCKDAKLRALPEGLIDPEVKTIGLYHEKKRLATLHYYACHPMSFYGDGRVTSDFVGMARERLENEDPGSLRLYFTGCAGNVAAGKYNDGSPTARQALAARMHAGMKAAEAQLEPRPVEKLAWSAAPLSPTPRTAPDVETLERIVRNSKASGGERGRAGFELAWRGRAGKKRPILVSSLHLDDISTLHLPASRSSNISLSLRRRIRRGDWRSRGTATAGRGTCRPTPRSRRAATRRRRPSAAPGSRAK